ncbi:hypothetical protein Tco_0486881 [Tanacetum coccineum]
MRIARRFIPKYVPEKTWLTPSSRSGSGETLVVMGRLQSRRLSILKEIPIDCASGSYVSSVTMKMNASGGATQASRGKVRCTLRTEGGLNITRANIKDSEGGKKKITLHLGVFPVGPLIMSETTSTCSYGTLPIRSRLLLGYANAPGHVPKGVWLQSQNAPKVVKSKALLLRIGGFEIEVRQKIDALRITGLIPPYRLYDPSSLKKKLLLCLSKECIDSIFASLKMYVTQGSNSVAPIGTMPLWIILCDAK